jgi:hypothetical protein
MPGDTLYHLLRLYKLKYISLVHSFNRLYHDDEDFHFILLRAIDTFKGSIRKRQ